MTTRFSKFQDNSQTVKFVKGFRSFRLYGVSHGLYSVQGYKAAQLGVLESYEQDLPQVHVHILHKNCTLI